MMGYITGKCLTDSIEHTTMFPYCQRIFQTTFKQFFTLRYLTPTVIVSVTDWTRPQVIMTGPHGVCNMGGIRSIITSDTEPEKNVVCAITPVVNWTYFTPILRLAGAMGMISLNHHNITEEMKRAKRDIIVIPGGFVETNTGNEKFATMDDSKWGYWVLQCLRHGYDLSFQWIHGATQIYRTGDRFIHTRHWMGRHGIPFILPNMLPKNTVDMSICSFRMRVETAMPTATKTSPEYLDLLARFQERVFRMVTVEYPPILPQAPLRICSKL